MIQKQNQTKKILKASMLLNDVEGGQSTVITDFAQEERDGIRSQEQVSTKRPDIGSFGRNTYSSINQAQNSSAQQKKMRGTSLSGNVSQNTPQAVKITKNQNSASRLHSARSNSKMKQSSASAFTSHGRPAPKNENLPPLNTAGSRYSMQSGQNNETSRASQILQHKVDRKVESGLVSVLEKKYQEVAQKLDKAVLDKQQSKFQQDILAKENQTLKMQLKQLEETIQISGQDNYSNQQQIAKMQADIHHINTDNHQLREQKSKSEAKIMMLEKELAQKDAQLSELYAKFGEAEKQWDQMQGAGREYYEQLQKQSEREKQQELKFERMQEEIDRANKERDEYIQKAMKKQTPKSKSPVKSQKQAHISQEMEQQFLDEIAHLKSHNQALEQQLRDSQQNVPPQETTNPENQLQVLRKKLKKEEETRKTFQELAKKREEESKKFQQQHQIMENQLKTVTEDLQKQKSVAIQRRDNKIAALEAKIKELSGQDVTPQKKAKPILQDKNVQKPVGYQPPHKSRVIMEQRKQQAKDKPSMAKSVKFTDSVSRISSKAPIDEEEKEEELVPMKPANFDVESDDETQQIDSSSKHSPLKSKDPVQTIDKVSPLKKKGSVPKMASVEESVVMPTPQVKKDQVMEVNKRQKNEIVNKKILDEFEEEDKLMVMKLPNTGQGDYDSEEDDYDDEVLDQNNTHINEQRQKNQNQKDEQYDDNELVVPSRPVDDSSEQQVADENKRLKEYLEQLRAQKLADMKKKEQEQEEELRQRDLEAEEVANLGNKLDNASDSSEIEPNNKFD